MAQSDALLLLLTAISVLIGLSRGFTYEILRLAVYVLAGVLGYALVPAVQPMLSFIPEGPFRKAASGFLATLVVWIVLKMVVSSIVGGVKKSCLKKLDRSLGGLFGGARALLFLGLATILAGIVSPATVRSSKIMSLLYNAMSNQTDVLPKQSGTGYDTTDKSAEGERQAAPEENGSTVPVDQNQGWKANLLNYLQNTTVHTKSGDKRLINALSSIVIKGFSKEEIEKNTANIHNEEAEKFFSDEEKKLIMEKAFEENLISKLNGTEPDGKMIRDFMEELTKKKLAEQ